MTKERLRNRHQHEARRPPSITELSPLRYMKAAHQTRSKHMPADGNRDPVKDFLLLRRFFTPPRLRFVWFVLLIVWLAEFAAHSIGYVNSFRWSASFDFVTWLVLTGHLLWVVVYLVLARLLLEVALLLVSRKS
jgi:hypothetical protein